MQDMVTPETLDELDRRVYDLAVQTVPLAEIAVRLGVPVAQADERIQRVCARLGVADRAGLRAWARPAEPTELATTADEPAVPEESAAPRRSRRAFIAAGGVAGLAIAGGAAGFISTRRNNAAPTGESNSADSTPAAAPVLPIDLEGGLGSGFAVARWLQGSTVDWRSGLFSMQTDSGLIEGIRFLPSDAAGASPFFDYFTGEGRRFVSATNSESNRGHLYDGLNSDASWSWPAGQLRLVTIGGTLPDNYLLFEEMSGREGTGRFHIADVAPGKPDIHVRYSFHVPANGSASYAVAAPGFQKLMLWAGSRNSPELYLVDARVGQATLLLGKVGASERSGLSNPSGDWTPFPFEVFPDWVRATWLVRGNGGGGTYLTASYDWDGNVVHDVAKGGYDWSFAPNRLQWVKESSERMTWIEGSDGGREFWTNVEALAVGARPPFRIRSASIKYGDGFPPRRWLADGSGFVVQVRGPSEPDGRTTYQGAVVSADGRQLTRLPMPPQEAEPRRWFEYDWHHGPLPAPKTPDLIAFGRLTLYNRRTNQWVVARTLDESGPAHMDPWSAGDNYLVFALPHGGHGGASGPFFLPPRIERPPFDEGMLFEVINTGNGLNLRDAPSTGSRVLMTVGDGTKLRIASDNSRPEGLRSLEWTPTGSWVYVEAPGTLYGWVFSDYLAWA